MSESTAIEWTDATWNPVTGCTKVSPGCAHCYIERTPPFRMAGRRFEVDIDRATTGVRLHHERLGQPLRWRKPRRVFVCSLADLFHDDVPDAFIEQVFVTMASAPRHTFQVLTKRPERALRLLGDPFTRNFIVNRATSENTARARARGYTGMVWDAQPRWPLPNVWVGVSVENARYTWRADVLRQIPAAVRFISAEPLLGSLFEPCGICGRTDHDRGNGIAKKPDGGYRRCPRALGQINATTRGPLDLTGIDWVIAGGESGPGARPMHPDWARELRDACLCVYCRRDDARFPGCDTCREEERPAFFFKQWGGRTPKANGRLLDGRTWDEFPSSKGIA